MKQLINQLTLTRRLIQLSLLFAMLILPIGAWAEVSYFVINISGDPQHWVTDETADDVLGDGSITYDAENNVLTLNNIDLSYTSDYFSDAFISMQDGDHLNLTVRLVGNNTLTLGDMASVFYGASITFMADDANGKLTINTQDGWSGGLFIDSQTSDPIDATYNNNLYLDHDATNSPNIYTIQTLMEYNLWILGVQVTSANASNVVDGCSFEASTNTLTFNEAFFQNDGEFNGPFISNGLGNLNINLVGNNTIRGIEPFLEKSSQGADNYTVTFTTDEDEPGMLNLFVNDLFTGHTAVYSDYLILTTGEDNDYFGEYYIIKQASLVVAGVIVTDNNASNITGQNITGTVSFDAENSVLTLNEATINGNIKSDINGLAVSLVGNSFINPEEGKAPFVFTGQEEVASLTFESTLADDGELTMDGEVTEDRDQGDQDIIISSGRYTFSNIFGTGESQTIFGDWMIDHPDGLKHIYYNSHYGITVGSYEVTKKNKDMITSMSGADLTYTPEDNTLHVPESYSFSDTRIQSHRESLNLAISGDCHLASIRFEYNEVFEAETGTLTIMVDPESEGGLNSLTLEDEENGAISGFESVTIVEPLVVKTPPEDPGVWGNDWPTAVIADYDNYAITLYKEGAGYDGVKVTDRNATDVLDDGTVSFDVESNTLTLNNATIVPEAESAAIEYDGKEDLTIMLIGSNNVQGAGGCEGIRVNYYDEEEETSPTLIFTTDKDAPGTLISNGEGRLFSEYTNVEYQNGLGLTTTATGQMIGIFESYNLWVMGQRVTSMNKENILGDDNASVRFNSTNNTLSLYGMVVGDKEYTDTIFSSSLPELTVNLHGNNIMRFYGVGFRSRDTETTPNLIFTTDANNPGQLSWDTPESEDLTEGFNVEYTEPLQLQASGNLISKTEAVTYDLTVGNIPVTSVNCTDILGDGLKRVKYVVEDKTLVLEDVYLDNMPITSGLAGGLTIYLLGDNVISGSENLITTAEENAMIVFTTSETAPGNLTLIKTNADGTWISGFAAASVPADYATTTEGNTMIIARSVPITPIVTETEDGEQPKTEESTGDFGWYAWGDPEEYLNVVINNVLYTLKAGDYNEGDWYDPDDPDGVNLSEAPEDMADVLTKTPGSDAYAEVFKGLTIEVPAGNGQVIVRGEIGANAKLAVQIGSNDPMVFPNDDFPAVNTLETLYIPYSCAEPTFVYIYLYQDAPNNRPAANSRYDGPNRGKVLTGHVKVTSVGAAASSMVSNNSYSGATNTIDDRVIAYGVPASANTDDNRGVVMSTVEVASSSLSYARGTRRAEEGKVYKKITELGTSVFDELDKDKILFIDLSETEIKDVTVNRNIGLFGGFGQNTLFYLPEGNDDGGEDNVILGKDNKRCARLSLTDEMDFHAPSDFNADMASLDRTFVPGQTSTLFLPFGLTSAQADAFGDFHRFKEISGNQAVFYDKETDDIPANTPFIFVPGTDKIEAANVEVKGLDNYFAVNGNLVGTYEKLIWDTDQTDIYGFAAAPEGEVTAGQFVRVNAGAWLPPFRAFLQVTSSSRRLAVVIGDKTTTGIDRGVTINGPASATEWHAIDGRRLNGKPTQGGMYINNGKIVIVR